MHKNLQQINLEIYSKIGLGISDFTIEKESREYAASRFRLKQFYVVCRNAKITPKKIGQFVVCWKRKDEISEIEPFEEEDAIDFLVINVRSENCLGQFVFPKEALINKGILSTKTKEGKRGFRLYPSWDKPTSKQAVNTQKWQLNYFYLVNQTTDLSKVKKLYKLS